jgi:prepilin-type N-terminal cleavage/methylation domain-containing protein
LIIFQVKGVLIIAGKLMAKAYTLVEILITIVVLGVLVAIALPVITGGMEKAIVSEGVNTVQTLHAAMNRYKLENGSWPSTNDCTALDVKITPKNFYKLLCNNATPPTSANGGGNVRVDRINDNYRLRRNYLDGSWQCLYTNGAPGNPKCNAITPLLPK